VDLNFAPTTADLVRRTRTFVHDVVLDIEDAFLASLKMRAGGGAFKTGPGNTTYSHRTCHSNLAVMD